MTPHSSSSQGDRVSIKEHNQTSQAHEIIDVQQVDCCSIS
jgi:hypothetical protein